VTVADNDAVVSIKASDPSASERRAGQTADPGTFVFSRTGPTTSALTVYYVISGTAANGVDYTRIAGSVTIAAGQSSALVTIRPVDDAAAESPETVVLTLSTNPAYALDVTAASPAMTIADNDANEDDD
jgi:hypothetical protein